jgi:predicted TIM-barrel fold metal-dependent hydrolase
MLRDGEQPVFQPPELACDSHFHIFGLPDQYKYKAKLRYEPPIATADDYLAIAKVLGIKRMVLVQPSAYGQDNSCQLDAAARLGKDFCRVVVDIDENIPDLELERMHSLGARGVRINVNPIEPLTPGLSDKLLPRIKRMESRCKEIGWSLDFLFPDWLTAEMMPHLRELSVPFSIAHIGMNRANKGINTKEFNALLDTLKYGDGFCWVKLTAAYRISNRPDYLDVVPLAQAVIEAAGDRIIWGSDYPHLSFGEHSTIKLFNLLSQIAPDEEMRKRILEENPAKLYGFQSD